MNTKGTKSVISLSLVPFSQDLIIESLWSEMLLFGMRTSTLIMIYSIFNEEKEQLKYICYPSFLETFCVTFVSMMMIKRSVYECIM